MAVQKQISKAQVAKTARAVEEAQADRFALNLDTPSGRTLPY